MPNPTVTSMELSTGETVPLSLSVQSGTPIQIVLRGSNLQTVNQVTLDSGPEIQWFVTGVSASANTVYITAYATGSPGEGFISVATRGWDLADYEGAYFELPLID